MSNIEFSRPLRVEPLPRDGLTHDVEANAEERAALAKLNGLPAIVAEYDSVPQGWGKRFVMRCDVDQDGRIREVHVIVASGKLTRVGAVGGADGSKQMTMESPARGLSN